MRKYAAILIVLLFVVCGCSDYSSQGHFEGDKYVNQALGVSINKPIGWSVLEEKKPFLFNRVVFRDSGDQNVIFVVKQPVSVAAFGKQAQDRYDEAFFNSAISAIRKDPRNTDLKIITKEKTQLNGKPANLIQTTHVYLLTKYHMANYGLVYKGKPYTIGYRTKEDKNFQAISAEVKSSIDSLEFL